MAAQKREAATANRGPSGRCSSGQAEQPEHSHSRLVFQRSVERLHELGPRPVGELLIEIADAHDLGEEIVARLERYIRLDRDLVHALGADRFPPAPIYEVKS